MQSVISVSSPKKESFSRIKTIGPLGSVCVAISMLHELLINC